MNLARTTTSWLLLAAIASVAHAEAPKTREQVKAELKEAIRTGDVLAGGDSGLKMNELYPQRYPHVAVETKTRAEVKTELAAAMREGTIVPAGEGGMTLRDEFPQRYPTVAVAPGRTREEVAQASLATIPLQRYGRADEFGAAAAFLASEQAAYITGVTLLVDGGLFRGTY